MPENDENKAWIEIIAFDTRTREIKILGTADQELADEIETSLTM